MGVLVSEIPPAGSRRPGHALARNDAFVITVGVGLEYRKSAMGNIGGFFIFLGVLCLRYHEMGRTRRLCVVRQRSFLCDLRGQDDGAFERNAVVVECKSFNDISLEGTSRECV